MVDHNFFIKPQPKHLHDFVQDIGILEPSTIENIEIQDIAPLQEAGEGDLTFFDNVKYLDDFLNTKASACILSPSMVEKAPKGITLLPSDAPYKSYALAAQIFYPALESTKTISEKAVIAESAKIGANCQIEPYVVIEEGAEIGDGTIIKSHSFIGKNVKIGHDCRIDNHVTLSHCILGDHVRLYPGVRIGQDGFGFAIDVKGHVKVPQLGRVIIGNGVEIGANSTIDRGAGPDTIIGEGSWIDNLVQIGHNVKIGRGCVVVAQAGIAGSAVMDDFSVLAAQAGVAGHLKIGKGAKIGAKAGVMRNIPDGEEQLGSPAMPVRQFMRQVAALRKLAKG